MALILLRQLRTGENPVTGIDTWEQKFFNSATLTIVTNTLEDGQLDVYQMSTGQLVFDTGSGTQYVYDGAGGVTSQPTPGTAVYLLQAIVLDAGGVQELITIGNYAADAVVAVSTTVPVGWIFVEWRRLGAKIADSLSFSFTMPAANTILQAVFIAAAEVPAPDPRFPIPDTFYDLEIRVNGQQIPIPSLVNKMNSGIFSDEFQGEYSFPLTVPIDPRLMIALGLPNDPQSSWDFSEPFPAELWSHGNRLYNCFLDILKADENAIRCTLVLDSGFFISRNQSLSLKDCYPAQNTISIADQPTYAVGGFEIRFAFRENIRVKVNTIQKVFVKTTYVDHITMLEAVADWLSSLGLGLEVRIEYSDDLTDDLSKIIYWDTTTITTCTLEEYQPNRGVWNTGRYSKPKKLTNRRFLMDEWNVVDEANRIAFPTVYNRELYEGNNGLHDGIVNRYDAQGRLYVSNIKYLTYSESFRWENVIVPYLYLTDVVRQLFRHLKIEVSGEFFDEDRVKRMLLYNNRTLDFVSVKINGTPSRRNTSNIHKGDNDEAQDTYFYENVHNLVISLRNHVPDYSVVEFLKSMKNYFGLKYDFNILQNRVEIRFVRSIIRSRTVLDLTKQASRLFTIEHGKSQGIAFSYDRPDPLMSDGSNPPPGGVGGGGADYTVTNFSALDALDAEILEVAYVRSLRASFQLTPDNANPPFWKLLAWTQQDDAFSPPSGGAGGGSPPSGGRGVRVGWNVGMVPLLDTFVSGRKMPGIECTADQPEVNLSNKESGIRIMAFYGQQEDGANQPYTFASCTRYNAKELLSAAQYDLDIRSADSYPFWEDLERILDRGKAYECALLLSSVDLVTLSKTPKIRIANIDYLIDTMEVAISTREFSVAKATLYKIK